MWKMDLVKRIEKKIIFGHVPTMSVGLVTGPPRGEGGQGLQGTRGQRSSSQELSTPQMNVHPTCLAISESRPVMKMSCS